MSFNHQPRMTRSPDRHADGTGTEHVIVDIDGLDELSAIREALDGIRDDVAWWLRNHRQEQWLPVQPITSMPLDPLAQDWAERLNKVTAADLPDNASPNRPERLQRSQPPRPTRAAEGLDDETQFCCEAPDLQWTGNAHVPGVACMNCGYIVADCGSVVMQPSPEADPDPEHKEQQRGLFAEE